MSPKRIKCAGFFLGCTSTRVVRVQLKVLLHVVNLTILDGGKTQKQKPEVLLSATVVSVRGMAAGMESNCDLSSSTKLRRMTFRVRTGSPFGRNDAFSGYSVPVVFSPDS